MKILCVFAKTRRDKRLVGQLAEGFRRHGACVDLVSSEDPCATGYNLVTFVGVRSGSIKARHTAKLAGVPTLMLDKGYLDRNNYHRFSLYTAQPTYVTRMDYDLGRLKQFEALGLVHFRPPLSSHFTNIIYVESTQKYYDFHDLGDVTEYSQGICTKLVAAAKTNPDLAVLYRPRAQGAKNKLQRNVVPAGTIPTPSLPFSALLAKARCIVVHGSNAGVEALCAGVPVLSVGSPEVNPVHDLCNTQFSDILKPVCPSRKAIRQRMAQLVWCQYTRQEISSGLAWDHTKRWM